MGVLEHFYVTKTHESRTKSLKSFLMVKIQPHITPFNASNHLTRSRRLTHSRYFSAVQYFYSNFSNFRNYPNYFRFPIYKFISQKIFSSFISHDQHDERYKN